MTSILPSSIGGSKTPWSALFVIKALYFFYYCAFGIFSAYINLYYHDIGMSGVQIGWIGSVAPLVGIFGGLLWGVLNDRFGKPRLLLAVAAIGTITSLLGVSVVRTFLWLLPLVGLYSLFNSTIVPLVDTMNLAMLGDERERYGNQRIWGSIGYIVTIWGFGWVLEWFGLHSVFPGYIGLMLFMLVAVAFLPNQSLQISKSPRQDLLKLVSQPRWLFFSASLILLGIASSSMYNFLSIYLKQMGASDSLVGSTWSLGALAELPVMIFGAYLIRSLGLKRMLSLAYLAYTARFLLYALMPSPSWAVWISLLHFFTFGMYWVAGVIYVNQMAPDNLKTTSQSLLVAEMGLASVIGAPISGYLYDWLGGSSLFFFSSGVCLVALCILWSGFLTEKNISLGR